jgi:hypothetical protein
MGAASGLRFCFLVWSLTFLAATTAQGQSLVGPESRLNSQDGNVFDLDVASGLDGVFTVVWSQATDPYNGQQQVVARRFQSPHNSGELTLVRGTIPDRVLELPRVAPSPGGGWVLFYSKTRPDGYEQLFGSRFSQQGSALGPRFQISEPLKSTAKVHAATTLRQDSYFVLAEDDLCPGCQFLQHHLFARILNASGQPTSPYFQVDTNPLRTGFCGAKSLRADALGNAVVVWEGEPQRFDSTQTAILTQRFSSTGQRLGGSFLVTKPNSATVLSPSVAVNPAGDFVVVWQYQPDPNTPRSLHARHFSKDAKPLGQEFVVEADPVADAIVPSIASDSRGNYVVVWTSYGSPYCPSVKGRLYRPDDTPAGPAFDLSSSSSTCDQLPKVAFGPNGTFAATWIRLLNDGGSDIYAAMFRVNP